MTTTQPCSPNVPPLRNAERGPGGEDKITYTSANVDWDLFDRQFDEALDRVRAQFGREYPLYIGGEAVTSSAKPIVDTSPIDTRIVLGNFATATAAHVNQAVIAALAGQAARRRRGLGQKGGNLAPGSGG